MASRKQGTPLRVPKDADYEIGRGRPPRHTRFQPGVSGNPKGRPSSGNGSVQHLAGELFMLATGAKMTHVPYKGSGQAIVDLVAGQVDLNFDAPPNVLPHLRKGKVRVLAIKSPERSSTLPEVPTLRETGVFFGGGGDVIQWFGIFGPGNLPKDIVTKLNTEIGVILQSPEVIERIKSQDGQVLGGSPKDFAAFIKEETARWSKLIKEANIKLE